MPHENAFSRGIPPVLLHDLPARAAACWPQHTALTLGAMDAGAHIAYLALHDQVQRVAAWLLAQGLQPGERVAIYLEKRLETVVGSFAATAAGGVLVPVNPVLKPAQVAHILQDAGVRVLLTSPQRLATLAPVLAACPTLCRVLLCDVAGGANEDAEQRARQDRDPGSDRGSDTGSDPGLQGPGPAAPAGLAQQRWAHALQTRPGPLPPRLETDVAAIFYTSGSTGQPKGVVLSHRNLVAGAGSVARYLGNHAGDTLLAALPLSFDAGFSQLTTACLVGARVVLINPLLPRDVLLAMAREGVTGLTAVPPLYTQLAVLPWPAAAAARLRYWANTGGRLPRSTLQQLQRSAPAAQPFLMYGLTEAFRSTYLPPEEVQRRPDSIGRAIPNATVHVLREDGSECAVDEPGELVHRGPLVALGYWRRPEETALRFRALPAALGGVLGGAQGRAVTPAPLDSPGGLVTGDAASHAPLDETGLVPGPSGLAPSERVVFSGDTVRRDAEGYLYFVGRRDEMIKTSGYRVSPTEVEACVHASGLVHEALALGRPHDTLGQCIVVVAVPSAQASGDAQADTAALLAHCRAGLPAYMVPAAVHWQQGPLPRNPNGKIDRQRWRAEHEPL